MSNRDSDQDKETPSRRETGAERSARREERRRRLQAARFDTSVPSPCISVCQLDNASSLCLGCRRTIDEIRDWPILTAEEKKAVLARIETRAAEEEPAR